MRHAVIAALIGTFLLTGCLGPEKIDTDSISAFEKSYGRITGDLSPEEKRAFDDALRDIVAVKVGLADFVLKSTSGEEALRSVLMEVAHKAFATRFETERAEIVVAQVAPLIDGMTVDQVLALADRQRKEAVRQVIAERKVELAKAESDLAAADLEQKAALAAHEAEKAVLRTIEVSAAKLTLHQRPYYPRPEPVISFTLKNGSEVAIRRFYAMGTLQTEGRSVPWIEAGLNYEIPGGIEPGETQSFDLTPNLLSDWNKVPEEGVKTGKLTIRIVEIENADGKSIGKVPDDFRTKRRFDEARIRVNDLKRQIEELERRAGIGS
ncbi:MAG: hypothetical protein LDL44_04290 [Caenispirillum sp.]|nr:hypothetical protein [Caenispirillum sp.]